ncbi:hypothetical protein R1sor_022373 [Riccia sorocarpa]|uniref:Uncharacterized protein n=1 Tax=Riccia sorocarpa TaxID=122646 RepID=A0ABD3GMM4_9MARC
MFAGLEVEEEDKVEGSNLGEAGVEHSTWVPSQQADGTIRDSQGSPVIPSNSVNNVQPHETVKGNLVLAEDQEEQMRELAVAIRSPERGTKGRPMDPDGTPDKGNQAKKRTMEGQPPEHKRVNTFSQLLPKRLEWPLLQKEMEPKPPDLENPDTVELGQNKNAPSRPDPGGGEMGEGEPHEHWRWLQRTTAEEGFRQNFSLYLPP